MQRYASARRLLPSLELGATQTDSPSTGQRLPVLSGYGQERRTASRNAARFSTRTKHGESSSSASEPLTRPKRAPMPDVTTAFFQSTSPKILPNGYSVTEGSEDTGNQMTPEGTHAKSTESEKTDPGATCTPGVDRDAFPDAHEYGGLGEALIRNPIGTVLEEFAGRFLTESYRNVYFRGDAFHCAMEFIAWNKRAVAAHGEGSSKSDAEHMAFRHLISQMHQNKMLINMVKKTEKDLSPMADLSVRLNDDLLAVMRRAVPKLWEGARRLSRLDSHRPKAPTQSGNYIARTNISTSNRKKRELSRQMRSRDDRSRARQPDWIRERARCRSTRIRELQVNKRKEEILDLIRRHTYIVVVAATGTGKSTQIPQIILDNAIQHNAGAYCRVVCVQPRRIAASSLARRVARERDEVFGDRVGYHIRFDANLPKAPGTITYCTTGVVLKLLQEVPGYLDTVSHIVLDEVHERDASIDILMLLLRNYIDARKAEGVYTPRVIVTSATIDVDLFASYFQNKLPDGTRSPALHIDIPGHTFEVTKHYLDDLLDLLKDFEPSTRKMLLEDETTKSYLGVQMSHVGEQVYGGEPASEREGGEPVPGRRSTVNSSPDPGQPAPHAKHLSEHNEDMLPNTDFGEAVYDGQPESENEGETVPESQYPGTSSPDSYDEKVRLMPLGLICAAVFRILTTSTEGGILVFLPGISDILKVENKLREFSAHFGFDFSDQGQFQILKLHSAIPESQSAPFEPVSPGSRRIILATNIAETSVTIQDVKFVVDTGKLRHQIYYPATRSSELAFCWVDQSSAAQRAGRAGRVRNGEYFALFTKEKYESFRVTKSPAVVRTDIHELCLKIKKAVPTSRIQDVIRLTLEPPEDYRVESAIAELVHMGALNENEELTILGGRLLQLPVTPKLGKLILLGVLFRCLDPLLILGALDGGADLFYRFGESDARTQAMIIKKLRQVYAEASNSDHITTINAFRAVRAVYYQQGYSKAKEFADSQSIHFPRFKAALMAAQHIERTLASREFIPHQDPDDGGFEFGGAGMNVNSRSTSLITSLLLHVHSRNVAVPIQLGKDRGYCDEASRPGYLGVSMNSSKPPRGLIVFDNKEPDGLRFLFNNSTLVTPLAASLLGGPLEVRGKTLCVDSWLELPVRVSSKHDDAYAVRLLLEMRKVLDMALNAALHTTLHTALQSPHPSKNFEYMCRRLYRQLVNDMRDIFVQVFGPIHGRAEGERSRAVGKRTGGRSSNAMDLSPGKPRAHDGWVR